MHLKESVGRDFSVAFADFEPGNAVGSDTEVWKAEVAYMVAEKAALEVSVGVGTPMIVVFGSLREV